MNAERGGVYPPFVDFIACHFPPLSFLYWIAGWRSSGHDLADVVAIHVTASFMCFSASDDCCRLGAGHLGPRASSWLHR